MDSGQITLTVATGISVLALLPVLTQFVNLFPRLCDSLVRTSVCVRIEDSRRVQRSRDLVFLLGFPAVITLVWQNCLYSPQWLTGLQAPLRLTAVAGVTAGYALMRCGIAHAMPMNKFSPKIREAAVGCPKNFWITLLPLLLLCGLACELCDIPQNACKIITFCLSGALYLLFLIRRFQIFAMESNYLTAILYLCALEILPTAILMTSALVF